MADFVNKLKFWNPTKDEGTKMQRADHSSDQLSTISYVTQVATEQPAAMAQCISEARRHAKESEYLSMFLPLKRSVLNFGCSLSPGVDPQTGKSPTSDSIDKLHQWLDSVSTVKFEPYIDPQTRIQIQPEQTQTNREMLNNLINYAWDEFILLDNTVAIWNDEQPNATITPMEKCNYQDTLGIPILKWTHGLSYQQIAMLPQDQQVRYKMPQILFDSALGDHFKVLKRAKVGDGFGWPRIYAIFRLMGEIESKEKGMHLMAFGMRRVTRWHKIGHAITNGDRSGKPYWFWKKERDLAIHRDWDDKEGFSDWTSNFDHTIEYPWPNMDYFDDTAFKGSNMRLRKWSGPLGEMLVATQAMPYLTPLLKSQCMDDRDSFATFITPVINMAYKPPVPISIGWSNLIFNEARLQAELLKFGLQQGVASVTTFAEEIGLNPEVEKSNKLEEANNPDAAKVYKPLWDSSHGNAPALGETNKPAAAAPGAAKGQGVGTVPGNPPGTQHTS